MECQHDWYILSSMPGEKSPINRAKPWFYQMSEFVGLLYHPSECLVVIIDGMKGFVGSNKVVQFLTEIDGCVKCVSDLKTTWILRCTLGQLRDRRHVRNASADRENLPTCVTQTHTHTRTDKTHTDTRAHAQLMNINATSTTVLVHPMQRPQ